MHDFGCRFERSSMKQQQILLPAQYILCIDNQQLKIKTIQCNDFPDRSDYYNL